MLEPKDLYFSSGWYEVKCLLLDAVYSVLYKSNVRVYIKKIDYA